MTAPIDRRSVVGGLAAGAILAPHGARAAFAAPAQGAGRAQHHRCRRRARLVASRVRCLQSREAEPRLEDHLCEGASARARRQDQGATGCRQERPRPRAHELGRAFGRTRAWALGRRSSPTSRTPSPASKRIMSPPRSSSSRRKRKAMASSAPIILPARSSNMRPSA